MIEVVFISIGLFFFFAGIVGLIRFPDLYTRIHTITKADNIGLGFIIVGVIIHFGSLSIAIELLLIWIVVMFASASLGYMIANRALKDEQ